MSTPLQALRSAVIALEHSEGKHVRIFVAHPSEAPKIELAIDRLMAEPGFENMPRPQVLPNKAVPKGAAYVICPECADLSNMSNC